MLTNPQRNLLIEMKRGKLCHIWQSSRDIYILVYDSYDSDEPTTVSLAPKGTRTVIKSLQRKGFIDHDQRLGVNYYFVTIEGEEALGTYIRER